LQTLGCMHRDYPDLVPRQIDFPLYFWRCARKCGDELLETTLPCPFPLQNCFEKSVDHFLSFSAEPCEKCPAPALPAENMGEELIAARFTGDIADPVNRGKCRARLLLK